MPRETPDAARGAAAPSGQARDGGADDRADACAAPTLSRDGDVLHLAGALTTDTAAPMWRDAQQRARGARAIDLSGVTVLDTTGAALVLGAARAGGENGDPLPFEGASRTVEAVLHRARDALAAPEPAAAARRLGFVGAIGSWGVNAGRSAVAGIGFVGEALVTLFRAIARPRDMRFSEVLRHLDEAGTRAFPLAILLGGLIGLILAFQASVPLRRYGGEVFIPQMVGISLLRELGPLMAGVILSGRTGSAFAAELGTMTVNEEVDALRIMGIDPMVLLVLPRMVAATLVMPAITLVFNLTGLLGMTGVMLALGYGPGLVVTQLQGWVSLNDLVSGLAKSAVFGAVVAGIGCRAGLGAGRGPRAVGDAATGAVVGGIVSVVVLDGIFAVLFFRLGW